MIPCLTALVLTARLQPADVPVGLDARWASPVEGPYGPAHAHARMPARTPAPPDVKVPYGNPYEDRVITPNFLVSWEPGVATQDQAGRAADALEAAWSALIEDGGWTPPVSSDRYLLWVLLVNDLASTGYTTEYVTDAYPDGYPVIYLNVAWANDPSFWRTLATHEFHHAVQYAMREGTGDGTESWAWEATAAWSSLAVEPDSSGIDYTTAWYTEDAAARFDTQDGYHEYGMVTFTTWLESTSPGAMLRAWRDGDPTPGGWDARFASAADGTPDGLWARFADDFAGDRYGRTAAWEDPPSQPLVDGVTGTAGLLGAKFYRAEAAAHVEVIPLEGEAVVAGGASREVEGGETFSVTAATDGARWELRVSDPVQEDALVTEDDATEEKDVGTCASAPRGRGAGGHAVALLAAAVVWMRRRRTKPDRAGR